MGADDTTEKEPPPKHAAPLAWSLRLVHAPGLASLPPAAHLVGGATTIGRGNNCTLVLGDDARGSRCHATIHVDAHQARLVDSSANGTFVNGRLVDETKLADGDVVRAGNSCLVVRHRPVAPPSAHDVPFLSGDSPAITELRHMIARVGPSQTTVLVQGETGTGKELVARALHALSRPEGPFVAVNCSAIPVSLAEATLFGHVRGAFTGADAALPGYFRAAEGGVLLLDEIGELITELQPKLLRVLEERAVVAVGSTQPIPVDLRIVAATNRDLAQAARTGAFRADLYARLAEVTLVTPPLRERPEDVLPILAAALGPTAPPLEADLVERLLLHAWPFNVREILKVAGELRMWAATVPSLSLSLVQSRLDLPGATSQGTSDAIPSRVELVRLLEQCRGVVADVARATGRSRKQVYRWLQRYGIDVGTVRDSVRPPPDDSA